MRKTTIDLLYLTQNVSRKVYEACPRLLTVSKNAKVMHTATYFPALKSLGNPLSHTLTVTTKCLFRKAFFVCSKSGFISVRRNR